MKNKCLRTIAGAVKANHNPVLEVEPFNAPIKFHLDQLEAKARYLLRAGGQAKLITAACSKIANMLRGKAGRRRLPQPPRATRNTTVPRKCWQILHSPIPSLLGLKIPSRLTKVAATTARNVHFQINNECTPYGHVHGKELPKIKPIKPSVAQAAPLE